MPVKVAAQPRTTADGKLVEVESVAYVVCDALGLDTSDYSFAYVARWSDGNEELLKETAERTIGCAKLIMDALEVRALGTAS